MDRLAAEVEAQRKRKKRREREREILPAQLAAWKAWWADKNAGNERDEPVPELLFSALSAREIAECYAARFGERPPNTKNHAALRSRLASPADFVRAPRTLTRAERVVSDLVRAFDGGIPTDAEVRFSGGVVVGAHGFVLAARCSNAPTCDVECSEALAKRIVRGIYTGKFDAMTMEEAAAALQAYEALGCRDLVQSSAAQLCESLGVGTVALIALRMRGISESVPELWQRVRSFLGKNLGAARAAKEWCAELEQIAEEAVLERRAKRRR